VVPEIPNPLHFLNISVAGLNLRVLRLNLQEGASVMKPVLVPLFALISTWLQSTRSMQREIAPRHQLGVYQRARCRPWIKPAERLLWSWISRHWPGWRDFLVIVQPRTVTAWQQARFRDLWRRLSQCGEPGRSPISSEIWALIVKTSKSNPGWGSPRIERIVARSE